MDEIVLSQSRFKVFKISDYINNSAEIRLHIQMMQDKIKKTLNELHPLLYHIFYTASHTSVFKGFMLLRDSWHDSKKKACAKRSCQCSAWLVLIF